MLTSTSSGCLPTDDCRPWKIEIHAGLSEADLAADAGERQRGARGASYTPARLKLGVRPLRD
jgi:hypothetical protein